MASLYLMSNCRHDHRCKLYNNRSCLFQYLNLYNCLIFLHRQECRHANDLNVVLPCALPLPSANLSRLDLTMKVERYQQDLLFTILQPQQVLNCHPLRLQRSCQTIHRFYRLPMKHTLPETVGCCLYA